MATQIYPLFDKYLACQR